VPWLAKSTALRLLSSNSNLMWLLGWKNWKLRGKKSSLSNRLWATASFKSPRRILEIILLNLSLLWKLRCITKTPLSKRKAATPKTLLRGLTRRNRCYLRIIKSQRSSIHRLQLSPNSLHMKTIWSHRFKEWYPQWMRGRDLRTSVRRSSWLRNRFLSSTLKLMTIIPPF